MTTMTMQEDELCDVCDEPRRLEKVTWRGMKLCRGHWRSALAGRDLTLAASITRTTRSMAGVTEAFNRLTETAKKWVPETDEPTGSALPQNFMPEIANDTIWGGGNHG